MQKTLFPAVAALALLSIPAGAQTFPKSVQKQANQHSEQQKLAPQAPVVPSNASLEDRRKALSSLFDEIWQDRLSHSPEFASSIGDKRYNDQLRSEERRVGKECW